MLRSCFIFPSKLFQYATLNLKSKLHKPNAVCQECILYFTNAHPKLTDLCSPTQFPTSTNLQKAVFHVTCALHYHRQSGQITTHVIEKPVWYVIAFEHIA